MTRLACLTAVLLAGVPICAWGQVNNPSATQDKGTYLGVLFKAVPGARYAESPALPRGLGVLITHVLPNSPAASADLHRDDILIGYDAEMIRDPEQLARLIRDDKHGRKVKLTFLRANQEKTVEATLALGPALQLASPNAVRAFDVPRSGAKQNGPPAVSISAAPQSDGGIKLTIEYLQENTGRYQKVTCAGTPAEIDREVQKLPARVQELTRVALKRIHALELNKATSPRSAPSPRPQP